MISKRDETPPWPERSAAAVEGPKNTGATKSPGEATRYKVAEGKTIVGARGPLNAGEEVTARDFDQDEKKGLAQLKSLVSGKYIVVAGEPKATEDEPKATEDKPKSD